MFFFRFSKGSARARECRASKPRDARNKGGARGHLRVSHVFLIVKPQLRFMVLISYCSTMIKWVLV